MTKEERRKYQREWRHKNKEKVKEYSKKACKNWRDKNPKYMKKYLKEYFQSNKDVLVERNKQWHKDNPDYLKNYSKKRKYKEQRKWNELNNSWRNTPEYLEWRLSVYERDTYTCQDCGKSGCMLHAHHIKSAKDHPDLRYDINNGKTLCVECHKKH